MKKIFLIVLMTWIAGAPSLAASPWAENPTYGSKMKGKFRYGLKNFFLGWTAMFIEPYQPKYKKHWEGFCVGIAQTAFYTTNGLIHLATFPIPVDFPDVGRGIHIPETEKKYSYKIKPAPTPATAPQAAVPATVTPPEPLPADSEKEAAILEALETAATKTVVGPDDPAAFPDEETPAENENQQ